MVDEAADVVIVKHHRRMTLTNEAVRTHDIVCRRRRTLAAWPLVPIGTDTDDCGGVAVVGTIDHHHVLVAWHLTGDPQREIIRFATRTDEEDDIKRRWEPIGQTSGVVAHLLIDESRVGSEPLRLTMGRHHPRVRMANVGDVIDRIEHRSIRIQVNTWQFAVVKRQHKADHRREFGTSNEHIMAMEPLIDSGIERRSQWWVCS